LEFMLEILGLNYVNPTQDTGVRSIVEEWKKALQEKNYILADKYRQMLIDNGVI
jgi:cysteinyl-tRNA synthetase